MLVQTLISGLAIGSVYALIALALVLINKATDIVNFAQGEMAMFGTFIAYSLLQRSGLPLPIVFLLVLPLGGLIGAMTERLTIRPLLGAPPLNALIVTIGLWMIFHYGAGWIWGFDPLTFPSLLPAAPVEIAGVRVSPNSLGIAAISLLLLALLYLFFEYTREGLAMRAASMNRGAAQLMGVTIGRVSMLSWTIAGATGAAAGMLLAPQSFVDVDMMFLVLLKALAGAVLGGFTSLPGAVLGGLVIGVTENLIGVYVSSAFKEAFAFLVIVLVLMIKPEGLLGKPSVRKV
jgi:branched-chain amino acid transport system permease protein